jgi:dihydrofolate synthase/folylpolyglutamate synthase
VLAHGAQVGADLWLAGRDFRHGGDRQQWHWSGRSRRYSGLAFPALRGANQLINASGVLAVLEALHQRLPVPAQAVRAGLATVELAGRFQIVPGQPTLVLDVAHNPQSVATLAVNLDQMGFYPRTHAVFGAMRDKDLAGLLRRMAPLVDVWHFCALDTPRAASLETLQSAWVEAAGAQSRDLGKPVHRHPDPATALRAALDGSEPADRIVVFGSFYTVGGVLKAGLPRRSADHVA